MYTPVEVTQPVFNEIHTPETGEYWWVPNQPENCVEIAIRDGKIFFTEETRQINAHFRREIKNDLKNIDWDTLNGNVAAGYLTGDKDAFGNYTQIKIRVVDISIRKYENEGYKTRQNLLRTAFNHTKLIRHLQPEPYLPTTKISEPIFVHHAEDTEHKPYLVYPPQPYIEAVALPGNPCTYKLGMFQPGTDLAKANPKDAQIIVGQIRSEDRISYKTVSLLPAAWRDGQIHPTPHPTFTILERRPGLAAVYGRQKAVES